VERLLEAHGAILASGEFRLVAFGWPHSGPIRAETTIRRRGSPNTQRPGVFTFFFLFQKEARVLFSSSTTIERIVLLYVAMAGRLDRPWLALPPV
jgi:hypothetical protein